jgi:AraC family transcriptional regulator
MRPRLEPDPSDRLAFGEFYGIFERRFDIPQFSFAMLAPGVSIREKPHTHEATHIIFVLDGDYMLSAGGRQRTVPSRSLIFVPAGTTHANYPVAGTRVLAISLSESQIAAARDCVRLPESESDFRNGDAALLADRLEGECRSWNGASPLMAAGICLELLAAIARRTEPIDRTPPRWLNTARDLLHDRCCDDLTIAEIADTVGIHPIHLSRTFRKFFGCGAGEYLRSCRIERAADALRSESTSIADVASTFGFADQSHFSKAFRRALGITPAEFRRQFARKD